MTNNLLQRRDVAGKLQTFVGPARKSGLRSPHGVTGGVSVGPSQGPGVDALELPGQPMTRSNTPVTACEAEPDTQTIIAAEMAYADRVPDYAERVAFLMRVRAAQLEVLNPFATRDQIGQQLMTEGLAVGRDAFARGQNPGEVFVALSDALGYRATTLAAFHSNRVH